MKFFLYSKYGDGAQILKAIENEGNTVGLYIEDKIYSIGWDGLLPKIKNPDSFIDKDTVILFDTTGNGKLADKWRKAGHLVYGAADYADRLEKDREFGLDLMQRCGIEIPLTESFKDFKEGMEFVQLTNKKLVFKPSGTMPCKLTFAAEPDELISYLIFVEKHFGKQIDDFILQEFKEGTVVSTELFCDGSSFLWPPNHTVEVKKVMNDELGPSTGCSGNITWPCDLDRIVEEGVLKVCDELIKENYIGQIDLNVVANEEGVYGLEWTPRFGYDATPTFLTLLKTDIGQFFSDLTRGQLKEVPVNEKFAGSVRLTIPPYPIETETHPELVERVSPSMGVPILNWEKYQGDIYFYEIMSDDGQLVHSGGTGVILAACATDEEAEKTIKSAYEICEEVKVPDKQYRTDLDKVLPKMVKEIEELCSSPILT